IEFLTGLSTTLQQHIASLQRALQLLHTGAEETTGSPLRVETGIVEFRDVHLGYVPEHEVLQGVTFTLALHAVTALVGPSGAGKTTLVDLLLRLYEPQRGQI